MIGNAIIEFNDLRKLSGLGERARMATIVRWLEKQGIPFKYDGNGGVWTTIDAMNAALGLPDRSDHEPANNRTYSGHEVL